MRTGTTLSVYTTPWSLLTNSMHETRNQDQLYATLSLYTTSWSLLTNYMHETRNHSISLYQEPLYLSIQHHGLFSPIKCMRPGTTLSVYTTPWSLLTNPIHENRGLSICLSTPCLFYQLCS